MMTDDAIVPKPLQIEQQMVVRDGQPIWRLCIGDLCVEDASGIRAHAALEATAQLHGIELPSGGDGQLEERSC